MQACKQRLAPIGLALAMAAATFSQSAAALHAVMRTTLGDIEIELLDEEAPNTVANFLNYVNDGDYQNSFVHRSAPGFVIQGGGFTFVDAPPVRIPVDDPVVNEFDPNRSNVRGTLAMAKVGDDPDSATSQWFINLADNSTNLDVQNGGFTVFARVRGDGMAVADTGQRIVQARRKRAVPEPPLRRRWVSWQVDRSHAWLMIALRSGRRAVLCTCRPGWCGRDRYL